MKSRAVLIAFVALVALVALKGCRTTLDTNTNGSLCASTATPCGPSATTSTSGLQCGPFEICDTSGATPVCRCGSATFMTTANAMGCVCSGTDPMNPGCGNQTSPSSTGQCFQSIDMTFSLPDLSDLSIPEDASFDIASGPHQCASAMTPVMCGSVLCPTGAWCDISTPAVPVCRCGSDDASASTSCMCSGTADPNNIGCLLGPVTGC
jgi:hypothetical protein